jgi:hypothetical protein
VSQNRHIGNERRRRRRGRNVPMMAIKTNVNYVSYKGEGKFHPRTCHEGPEGV